MLRYLRRLSDRDFALDRGMIPLGSCTMKLNATTEMEPIGLPGFADIHPVRARGDDAPGYLALIDELEGWLADVTGYAKVSVQPNAGSQGELAGLLAIRAYHRARGQPGRDVCLIPSSAHGTNAASAVMAGMRVVVVAGPRRRHGRPRRPAGQVRGARATTWPPSWSPTRRRTASTRRASPTCARWCTSYGGQVYIDGANLNALLGLAQPGRFGGDVSHLNLHKTFCIPHGGGGPGRGPRGGGRAPRALPPVASPAPAPGSDAPASAR